MQLLDLALRPMCNLLLQTNALVQDEWDAEKIFPLHTRFSGQHAGLRQKKPPRALSGKDKYSYFVVSTGVSSTARSRLPWSNRSVTSVASLL